MTLLKESNERAHFLGQLLPGAHIHISGICGTGTAAVASLLKQLGFKISGSDKAFYPPMGDVVRGITKELHVGYSETNLSSSKPDLVVIGNSLSGSNPEVEYVLSQGIPYASMPEVFQALLIGDRKICPTSIVVSGTHGKTTTSAMIATLFDIAGLKPGFFIGGAPANFKTTIRPVDLSVPLEKRCVVIEGDEYDSAFFAKWPKFLSYRPDVLVVTSLEFDHADIYSSLEEIEAEFRKVVALVPEVGTVLVHDEVATKFEHPNLKRYGEKETSDYRVTSREVLGAEQKLKLLLSGKEVDVVSETSGKHNALNALVTAAVGQIQGLTLEEISAGIREFQGVSRRQQKYQTKKGTTVIEDFAHHPTAVKTTLEGIREQYPDKRIVAVFEPRSNTSRRSFFQDRYQQSFAAADVVVIKEVTEVGGYSKTGEEFIPLDVKQLVLSLENAAVSFPEVAEIQSYLTKELTPDDIVVIMSNGDFGGLLGKVLECS